jgi:hypothetical protein
LRSHKYCYTIFVFIAIQNIIIFHLSESAFVRYNISKTFLKINKVTKGTNTIQFVPLLTRFLLGRKKLVKNVLF